MGSVKGRRRIPQTPIVAHAPFKQLILLKITAITALHSALTRQTVPSPITTFL
jgi:hypothetical protein